MESAGASSVWDPLAPVFSRAGAALFRPWWHRVPVAVLCAVLVLQFVVIVVALWTVPGQAERHRAVTGDQICGTDPAPCLEERSGTLGVGPDQSWIVTDNAGEVWDVASSLEIPAGEQVTLFVYPGPDGDASPVSLLHEGRQFRLADGNAPGINLAVAVALVALRTAWVFWRRGRSRYASLRADNAGARVWWAITPSPTTVWRWDVESLAWWGVALAAAVFGLFGSTGVWTYWILAPIALALFHVAMNVTDEARARRGTSDDELAASEHGEPQVPVAPQREWHLPGALWVVWILLCAVGAFVCAGLGPDEAGRARAVSEQRLCAADAAPCQDQVIVEAVLTENDAESCGRGGCTYYDAWEITDPDGVVHVYSLETDSEQWMVPGRGEALAYRTSYDEWSLEFVRSQDGNWVGVGAAGAGSVAFVAALAVFFARSAVGVLVSLPRRIRAGGAVLGPARTWWAWRHRDDQVLPRVDAGAPWWAFTCAALAVVLATEVWWAVVPTVLVAYVVARVLTEWVRHRALRG